CRIIAQGVRCPFPLVGQLQGATPHTVRDNATVSLLLLQSRIDSALPDRTFYCRRIEAAMADTSKQRHAYMQAHAEFIETGNRMLQQREQGAALSLRVA